MNRRYARSEAGRHWNNGLAREFAVTAQRRQAEREAQTEYYEVLIQVSVRMEATSVDEAIKLATLSVKNLVTTKEGGFPMTCAGVSRHIDGAPIVFALPKGDSRSAQ
jgi:hypothetical protein